MVPVEGCDAVTAVRHHRRVVVHGEVDWDARPLALAEAAADEVRHPEKLGRPRRVARPAAGLQVQVVPGIPEHQERLAGARGRG
jgi:hypothetical protein